MLILRLGSRVGEPVFESMLHTPFIWPEDLSKPTGRSKLKQRMPPAVRMETATTGSIIETVSERHPLEPAVAVHCNERKPFALLLLRCVIADDDDSCLRNPSWTPYGLALTSRLKAGIRRYDRVLWEGGECFALILRMVEDSYRASQIADRIRRRLNHPLLVEGRSVEFGVRIGQAIYPEDGRETHRLIQKAELALSGSSSSVSALQSHSAISRKQP